MLALRIRLIRSIHLGLPLRIVQNEFSKCTHVHFRVIWSQGYFSILEGHNLPIEFKDYFSII